MKVRLTLPSLGLVLLLALALVGPGQVYGQQRGAGHEEIPVGPEGKRAAIAAESIPLSDWLIDVVDLSKDFSLMGNRSLALDADGYPHIAYGNDGLYYAWYDGASWHYETVDASPGCGQYTSLEIDAAGHPHISYYNDALADLMYAHFNGTDWLIDVVDPNAGSC